MRIFVRILLFIAISGVAFGCKNATTQAGTDSRLQVTANLSDAQRYPFRFVYAFPNPSNTSNARQVINIKNITTGDYDASKWLVKPLSSGATLYVNPKDTLIRSVNVNGTDNNVLILYGMRSTNIAINPSANLIRRTADTLLLIAPDGKTVQVLAWQKAAIDENIRP